MTSITLRGLTKSFDGTPALRGVDLDVAPGEFLSLLGPSGCGKTTALRLIAGLEAPDAGEILLDGQDITPVAAQDRNIGMVFQSYALFPHMRVRENIAFGLSVRGQNSRDIDQQVEEMLGVVQLDGLGERFPAQLSGGQRQRVALARTLITQPRVLMLDEPLANLDINLRAEMRAVIRELQQRFGLTTVLVTHDQSEALELSDRVAVMLDGRIAQIAAPETIYRQPRTTAVAEFLGGENIFPAEVRAGEAILPFGTLPVPSATPEGPGYVLLRSETIQLAPGEGTGLHGKVIQTEFNGATIRYLVDLGGPHMLVTASASTRLDQGTPVRLSIAAKDVWVLPH